MGCSSHAKRLHQDSGTALYKSTDKVTEIPTAAPDSLQEAQEQLGIYKTGDLDLKVRVSIMGSHRLCRVCFPRGSPKLR